MLSFLVKKRQPPTNINRMMNTGTVQTQKRSWLDPFFLFRISAYLMLYSKSSSANFMENFTAFTMGGLAVVVLILHIGHSSFSGTA